MTDFDTTARTATKALLNRRSFLTAALALGATSAVPAFAQSCPTPALGRMPDARVREYTKLFHNWVFNANERGYLRASPARAGSGTYWVSLKGIPPIKFLQYERQPRGINLGWTTNAAASTERASRRFFFVKRSGDTGTIRYGDRLALAWDRPKPFIRYKRRKNGINLVWSDRPSFEWTILGGGRNGSPVAQGGRAALFNTVHDHPMHYFDRSRAGHIGWPDSSHDFWTKLGTGYIGTNSCTPEQALRALRFLANT